jgi:predicted HAD superfamily phosphohydrolase YqeG
VAVRSVATGASSFTTLFQVLPRLGTVVRHMRPTWHLPALAAVDSAFLERHGIAAIIWDVDGTLTGDRQPALHADAKAPFLALLGHAGTQHLVLSNASEERYRQLGTMFPEMPILRAYERAGESGNSGDVRYRRLQGMDDSWTAQELEQRLADGYRVIRKPNALLVDYAVREFGLTRDQVVMVGDQYMTDIAGANLGGVRSIKLPTLAGSSFRRVVRFSQYLERAIYLLLYGIPRRRGGLAA